MFESTEGIPVSNRRRWQDLSRATDRRRLDLATGHRDSVSNEQDRKILGKAIKANYDRQVDVLTVVFSDAQVAESDEVTPGIILDFDLEGNVLGIEILDASRRVTNPAAMEFSVRAA